MATNPQAEITAWDDPKSEYHRTHKEDGQLHIHGTVYLDDTSYSFYLNQQHETNCDGEKVYIAKMRGEITVCSHGDGLKLQKKHIRDAETGKYIHPQGGVVRHQCYVSSTKNNDIKAHILKGVINLRKKHFAAIEADLAKVPLALLSPSRAVNNYGKLFLGNRHLVAGGKAPNEETINKNFAKLDKLAKLMGNTAMADVTHAQLKKIYELLGKSASKIFGLGYQFWDYCRSRGLYHGQNPFYDFFVLEGKIGEAPEDVRIRGMRPKALPAEIEGRFVAWATGIDIPTERDVALVLAHDGFTATSIAAILQNAITRDTIAPGSVCVQMARKDNAAATHDFTRPLSPLAANIVSRYVENSSRKSDHEGNATPLLKGTGGKRISSRVVTADSRTKLMELGMSERDMRADADTIYGVGIDLLQRNYKHWLQYHCGLENDKGAVTFLRTLTPSDVTTDNYRSFTCLDGQQHLLAAFRRDKRFWPKPVNADISIDEDIEGGYTQVSVPAADPERYTEFEIELELCADDWVKLFSGVCLSGNIEVVIFDDQGQLMFPTFLSM